MAAGTRVISGLIDYKRGRGVLSLPSVPVKLVHAMLWFKALHIIFVVTWFAGLFYLPRLFVYHTLATDAISIERFKLMERKLFYGIMTPSAVLAVAFGLVLFAGYGVGQGAGWMHAKLLLVLILIAHHAYLGKLMIAFRHDRNAHGHVFYRWLNEIPAVPVLFGVVILVVVKPF
jgi:putative membrane protein